MSCSHCEHCETLRHMAYLEGYVLPFESRDEVTLSAMHDALTRWGHPEAVYVKSEAWNKLWDMVQPRMRQSDDILLFEGVKVMVLP